MHLFAGCGFEECVLWAVSHWAVFSLVDTDLCMSLVNVFVLVCVYALSEQSGTILVACTIWSLFAPKLRRSMDLNAMDTVQV
jgi:hypothetical protein